ncbi:CBS domain-containing protein [uncultured Thiodictyon sp.]|uniref:magnesium transporter MgtE N-terminal domain-containing protein n=1 Tax=uncultured Thiodictyon sp. TaxID=1846217 RepID=UPI0025D4AAB5|nr:CBS domain-containing protein [uncultured Thiodictyon sp.]
MNTIATAASATTPSRSFLLSETLKRRVLREGKKIGRLKDFIIEEAGAIPRVTEIIVARPFGLPTLVIPIASVTCIDAKGISIAIEDVTDYQVAVPETALLLGDFVLDKKVIDLEGREISVVFDVKLLRMETTRQVYVTDVEFGRKGLYRRLGLKWLANSIGDDDMVSWSYVQPLPDSIGSFKGDVQLRTLKEQIGDMPPVDLADIIEELDSAHRTAIFRQLDEESASDTLAEIEPSVQRQLIADLDRPTVARLLDKMTPPQAADILAVIPYDQKQPILKLLDPGLTEKILAIMDKQEESIINYTSDRFIRLRQDETIGFVKHNYATVANAMDVTMYIYVIGLDETSGNDKALLGVLDIKEILMEDEAATLGMVMSESVVSLAPQDTLRDAQEAFLRYGFRALPVITEDKTPLGVILYKDVMGLKHRFVS